LDPRSTGDSAASYLCVSFLTYRSLAGNGSFTLEELFDRKSDISRLVEDLGKRARGRARHLFDRLGER